MFTEVFHIPDTQLKLSCMPHLYLRRVLTKFVVTRHFTYLAEHFEGTGNTPRAEHQAELRMVRHVDTTQTNYQMK